MFDIFNTCFSNIQYMYIVNSLPAHTSSNSCIVYLKLEILKNVSQNGTFCTALFLYKERKRDKTLILSHRKCHFVIHLFNSK